MIAVPSCRLSAFSCRLSVAGCRFQAGGHGYVYTGDLYLMITGPAIPVELAMQATGDIYIHVTYNGRGELNLLERFGDPARFQAENVGIWGTDETPTSWPETHGNLRCLIAPLLLIAIQRSKRLFATSMTHTFQFTVNIMSHFSDKNRLAPHKADQQPTFN
jgi:hypothetical protein